MSEQVAVLEPPRYLAPIEHVAGLEFFSDHSQEAAAHTNLALLPPEAVQARAGPYIAGLRLLATVRSQMGLSKKTLSAMRHDRVEAIRRNNRDAIGEIRGELMTIDQGLETDAVRALRLALEHMPEKPPKAPKRRVRSRSEEPAGILPAHYIPVGAGSKIVNIETGNLQNQLWPPGQTPRKFKLPGSRAQCCCTWEELREIAEGEDLFGRVRGLRPGVEIDWDRLPEEGQPDNEYARELQEQFITGYKRAKAPEGTRYPVAKLHHVTLEGLCALMGGGYKFAQEYIKDHGLALFIRHRRDCDRTAQYLRMEEAAIIWEAYEKIPMAAEDDMIMAAILRKAGIVVTQSVRDYMTDQEVVYIEEKRALRPKGRVLDHLPAWLGDRLVRRMRAVTLPPHLLPSQCIPNLQQISLRDVRARRREMSLRTTRLRLEGGLRNLPQVCYDWSDIRKIMGDRATLIRIDFDALPRGPNETDPQRIAYARKLQAQLVPLAMQVNFNKPLSEPAVPTGVSLLPIVAFGEPVVPATARLLPLVAFMRTEAAEVKDFTPAEADEPAPGVENPAVWRPGQTKFLAEKVVTVSGSPTFVRHPLDAVAGLPAAVAPKLDHPLETPGSWRPAERSGKGFISITEYLSARQIASGLGIAPEAVDAVIAHLKVAGQTSDKDPGIPIYHGQELLLIREQLIGVPLEHITRLYELKTQDDVQRLVRYLQRQGFDVFDGYVSPGAFKEACKKLTTTLLASEEPEDKSAGNDQTGKS